MQRSKRGREISRDVEAVYVLEPHYSRLRYEYEREGWVSDNVFWEQLNRSLDRLLDRIAPTMALYMAYHAFYLDGVEPRNHWGVNVHAFLKTYYWGVNWDRDEFVFGVKGWDYERVCRAAFWEEALYDDWYFGIFGVRIPLGRIFLEMKHTAVLGDDGFYHVPKDVSKRLYAELRSYLQKAEIANNKLHQFPYSFSAEAAIRKYTTGRGSGEVNAGDLRYAKAIDMLSRAYGKSIPQRIIAFHVAVNTVHGGYAVETTVADEIGLSYGLLNRLSSMGVLPKATAKRFLESVGLAVDMIVEGVLPSVVACQIV